jgi:hypothetical protein
MRSSWCVVPLGTSDTASRLIAVIDVDGVELVGIAAEVKAARPLRRAGRLVALAGLATVRGAPADGPPEGNGEGIS